MWVRIETPGTGFSLLFSEPALWIRKNVLGGKGTEGVEERR